MPKNPFSGPAQVMHRVPLGPPPIRYQYQYACLDEGQEFGQVAVEQIEKLGLEDGYQLKQVFSWGEKLHLIFERTLVPLSNAGGVHLPGA